MSKARCMKKGLFLLTLFCTAGVVLGSGAGIGCVAHAEAENNLEITEVTTEKFTRVEVSNLSERRANKLLRKNDGQLSEFAERWELDLETLSQSDGVIIQQQTFALDDGIVYNEDGSVAEGVNPSDLAGGDSGGISPLSTGYNKDTVNNYMTLNTAAYKLDGVTTPAGNPVFKIVGNAKLSKQFFLRDREEIFTITGGENSIYYDDIDRTGLVTFKKVGTSRDFLYENVTPSFGTSYGVIYKFTNRTIFSGSDVDLASIAGTHFLILTSDSSVQVSYIHNEKIFGGNLSINVGPIGFNTSGSHTEYAAEPVTLYYE